LVIAAKVTAEEFALKTKNFLYRLSKIERRARLVAAKKTS